MARIDPPAEAQPADPPDLADREAQGRRRPGARAGRDPVPPPVRCCAATACSSWPSSARSKVAREAEDAGGAQGRRRLRLRVVHGLRLLARPRRGDHRGAAPRDARPSATPTSSTRTRSWCSSTRRGSAAPRSTSPTSSSPGCASASTSPRSSSSPWRPRSRTCAPGSTGRSGIGSQGYSRGRLLRPPGGGAAAGGRGTVRLALRLLAGEQLPGSVQALLELRVGLVGRVGLHRRRVGARAPAAPRPPRGRASAARRARRSPRPARRLRSACPRAALVSRTKPSKMSSSASASDLLDLAELLAVAGVDGRPGLQDQVGAGLPRGPVCPCRASRREAIGHRLRRGLKGSRRGLRRLLLPHRRVGRAGRAGADVRAARLRVGVRHRAHPRPGQARDPPPRLPDELPREYKRIHDPFVSLATMAAATERISIGTAICLIVERDPIVTAKEVASIDRLSRRALHLRRRRRLAAGGDAKPRHRPRAALRADARAGRGDEGDLDRGRGLLPRQARRLRPDLVLAEAGPAAPPAGADRRQRRQGARPRARLRRRLVPQPDRRRGAQHPPHRGAPAPRRRGRPRPDPGHAPDPAQGPRLAAPLRAGRRHPQRLHAARHRRAATRTPPSASSTSGPGGSPPTRRASYSQISIAPPESGLASRSRPERIAAWTSGSPTSPPTSRSSPPSWPGCARSAASSRSSSPSTPTSRSSARRPTPPSPTSCRASTSASTTPSSAWR